MAVVESKDMKATQEDRQRWSLYSIVTEECVTGRCKIYRCCIKGATVIEDTT